MRLHLVDGTYELYRAHFSPRPGQRAKAGWDNKATVGLVASLLSLMLFLASLVLTWRQTNAVLNKGPAMATALFVGMFVSALAVLIALQTLFGLNIPDQLPG